MTVGSRPRSVAAGNSGPTWGTLLNPADEAWTVGVGGLHVDGSLAGWSSRGMTLWEQPHGAGRIGVDVTALGEFWAAHPNGGCQYQWGTSVACPVVVGVVALLLSAVGRVQRGALRSPAALKQVLWRSAARIDGPSIMEQGAGALRPHDLFREMQSFRAHASTLPPAIDLLDCPYMAPECEAPLHAGAPPRVFNLTVLDSASPAAVFARPPLWRVRNSTAAAEEAASRIEVSFVYSRKLAAWTGFLGVSFRVPASAAAWEGTVEGEILIEIADDAANTVDDEASTHSWSHRLWGADPPRRHLGPRRVIVPVRLRVERRPPRARRLLFDLYHSSGYPHGFFPTDDLERHSLEMMDAHGDHPHTNYRTLARALRAAGFSVDLLTADWSTFNASEYGALLLIDPEERLLPHEPAKLRDDVRRRALGVVVVADWYDPAAMRRLYYRDERTKQPHHCGVGGANVPVLNALLAPFGLGFRFGVFSGTYTLAGRRIEQLAGSAIGRAPAGACVVQQPLRRLRRAEAFGVTNPGEAEPWMIEGAEANDGADDGAGSEQRDEIVGVAALVRRRTGGWVLALTDSSCLDDEPIQPPSAYGRSPPKLQCRSSLVAVLNELQQRQPDPVADGLEAVDTTANDGDSDGDDKGGGGDGVDGGGGDGTVERCPASLSPAERLRRPLELPASQNLRPGRSLTCFGCPEGLSAAQALAFRAQSRVWAVVQQCTVQSSNCTLPLVPPPRWERARSLASANPAAASWLRAAAAAGAPDMPDAEGAVNEYVLPQEVARAVPPAGTGTSFSLALSLNAVIGLICVVAFWVRLGRSRRRRWRERVHST